MKKIILIVTIALVFAGLQPAYAYDFTPQFDQNSAVDRGKQKSIGSVTVQDSFLGGYSTDISTIHVARRVPASGILSGWAICSELTDDASDIRCGKPNILTNEYGLSAILYAPDCSHADVTPCIKSVEVSENGGTFIAGNFIGYSHQGRAQSGIKSDAELGLPKGESPAKYRFNTAALKDTDFAIASSFDYELMAGKKFALTQFSVEVAPIIYAGSPSSRFTSYWYGTPYQRIPGTENWPNTSPMWSAGVQPGDLAMWSEDGRQAVKANIPEGLRIRVSMKLPKSVPNWFFGQMQNVSVQSHLGADSNLITVEADPASIQQIAFESLKATTTDLVTNETRFTNWLVRAGDSGSIRKFLDLLPEGFNHSLANENVWRFGSNTWASSPTLSGCLKAMPGFGGMVSSNAPLFDSAVPTFQNGFFDFNVAGLHYAADNRTVNLGTYDLVIPTQLAKCLYGFDSAPIGATISVLGETDTSNITTTTMTQKSDLITFSARGFTFSAPTIRVKLTQTPVKLRLITIACYKGKTIKKVTSTNPKCPTGFKKR